MFFGALCITSFVLLKVSHLGRAIRSSRKRISAAAAIIPSTVRCFRENSRSSVRAKWYRVNNVNKGTTSNTSTEDIPRALDGKDIGSTLTYHVSYFRSILTLSPTGIESQKYGVGSSWLLHHAQWVLLPIVALKSTSREAFSDRQTVKGCDWPDDGDIVCI